jgi:hypothetical protein
MKKVLFAVAMTIALGMLPNQAQAAAIEGSISMAGTVQVTCPNPPTCTGGVIDFFPFGGPAGIASIGLAGNTNYFSVFNGGVFDGVIANGYRMRELDLAAGAQLPGPPGTFPEILNFETSPSNIQPFTAGGVQAVSPRPNLTFSLAAIAFCQQGCGFGFAPQFNVAVTLDPNGVPETTVFMNFAGVVSDPGSGFTSNIYTGTISAQFPGESPAQLLARLQTNGTVITTYSLSKLTAGVDVIPEPATLFLFGAGSVVIAARARYRAMKTKKAAEKA